MKSVSCVTLFAFFLVICGVLVNATKLGIPYPLPVCTGTNNDTTCIWETVDKNADVVKIIVISPGEGPLDKGLLDLVVKAQVLGISVYARIDTDLGKAPLVDIKAKIDLFHTLYKIDGIFFDQIPSDCSCQTYFSDLYAHVKANIGGLVVLNAKVNVPECFGLFADILVVFDSVYADYLKYVPAKWFAKYPASTFWHVIRGCPPAQQRAALLRAIKNRAGFIFLSADVDVQIGNGHLLDLDLNLLVRLLRILGIDLFLDLKL
jgi:hypothetical protein